MRRSKGVTQTLVATAEQAPREADIAFERLYRSSRDDVYAYAAGILRDRAAAEEVTATAFERAYRKRRRFDPGRGEPRAWLFGIARNAALDELRRRGRQAELAAEPADAARSRAPDAASRQASVGSRSTPRWARSAPRERELIALKFFAGLGNAEIAAVLGISESNAGTRLHRAVTKLREACDESPLGTTPSSPTRCARSGPRRDRSSPPSSTRGPPPASRGATRAAERSRRRSRCPRAACARRRRDALIAPVGALAVAGRS